MPARIPADIIADATSYGLTIIRVEGGLAFLTPGGRRLAEPSTNSAAARRFLGACKLNPQTVRNMAARIDCEAEEAARKPACARFAPVFNPAGTGGYDIVDRDTGSTDIGDARHWFSSLHFAEKACEALNAGKPCPSMSEMCEAPSAAAPVTPLPCHLIPTPSGRFTFAGRVPADLAFEASNPDFVTLALQCGPGLAEAVAKREGGTFRKLSWASEADAYAYAAGLGYAVPGSAAPTPAMVPQPVQQQQAQDVRATATPAVNARHGAPMGRRSAAMPNLDPAEKIQLSRIRLDTGGYDAGGAYWGLGAPLWCAMDHTGETAFFRARDREAAKAHVRDGHDTPEQVRFYR